MKKTESEKVLSQWRGYRKPDIGKSIRSFAEIIPAALAKLGLQERFKETVLQDRWQELMGHFIADHTRPAGFQRNILTVEVDHSAWLHELSLLHKKIMLEKLQEHFPNLNIKNIKFRLRG